MGFMADCDRAEKVIASGGGNMSAPSVSVGMYTIQPVRRNLTGVGHKADGRPRIGDTVKAKEISSSASRERVVETPSDVLSEATVLEELSMKDVLERKLSSRGSGVADPQSGLGVVGLSLDLVDQLKSMKNSFTVMKMDKFCGLAKPVQDREQFIIFGVIYHRSELFHNTGGQPYVVCRLYDMQSTVFTMMLFGDVCKTHLSRLHPGNLVQVANPGIRRDMKAEGLDERTGYQQSKWTFTVNNEGDLFSVGRASDYDTCIATTKTGVRCTSPINLKMHDDTKQYYCMTHMISVGKQQQKSHRLNITSNHNDARLHVLKPPSQSSQASSKAPSVESKQPVVKKPVPVTPVYISADDPFAKLESGKSTSTTTSTMILPSNVLLQPEETVQEKVMRKKEQAKENANTFQSVQKLKTSSIETKATAKTFEQPSLTANAKEIKASRALQLEDKVQEIFKQVDLTGEYASHAEKTYRLALLNEEARRLGQRNADRLGMVDLVKALRKERAERAIKTEQSVKKESVTKKEVKEEDDQSKSSSNGSNHQSLPSYVSTTSEDGSYVKKNSLYTRKPIPSKTASSVQAENSTSMTRNISNNLSSSEQSYEESLKRKLLEHSQQLSSSSNSSSNNNNNTPIVNYTPLSSYRQYDIGPTAAGNAQFKRTKLDISSSSQCRTAALVEHNALPDDTQWGSSRKDLTDALAFARVETMVKSTLAIDRAEQALDKIMERPTKVYRCNEPSCMVEKKWRERRIPYCFEKGHAYAEKTLDKRWFRCDICQDRVTTLARILPVVNCKCSTPGWKQVSEFGYKDQPKPQNGLILRLDDALGGVPGYIAQNERDDAA